MAVPVALQLPIQLLATGRYVPAGSVPGSPRPTGKELTGSDLVLLWLLLDAARGASDDHVVNIPQTVMRKGLGKASPPRIEAALERLRGTDINLPIGVMPAVVGHQYVGQGKDERVWAITLDRRAVRFVKEAAAAKLTLPLALADLLPLRSKFSVAFYGRWKTWLVDVRPSGNDIVGMRDGRLPAFQWDVPYNRLGDFFGFYGELQPSWIKRLLVTKSPACPLKGELAQAGVIVDSFIVRSEAFERDVGLRIQAYTGQVRDFDYLRANEERRGAVVAMRAAWSKQYKDREANRLAAAAAAEAQKTLDV